MVTKQLQIELRDVGPHEHLPLVFAPGANVLRGRNGAGKSTAISAVTAALGGRADVTIRDGQQMGQVVVDGVVVLQIGKRLSKTGEPSVELGNHGALAAVIDPGIVNPATADEHRVRAILALAPVPVTPDVILKLTSGSPHLSLESLEIPEEISQNVLAVAEHIRRCANGRALESEKQSNLAKARSQADGERLAEMGVDISALASVLSVTEAERIHADAVSKFEQTQLLAKQRKDAEERNERIIANMTPLRDLALIEAEVEGARKERTAAEMVLEKAREALRDAERAVTVASSKVVNAKLAYDEFEKDRTNALRANADHAKQRAILDEPITGPREEDVEAAKIEREIATQKLNAAKKAAEAKKIQIEIGEFLVLHDEHFKRSIELRELAHAVSAALGDILSDSGIAGLEIDEHQGSKRLFATQDGKKMLFADRLSFGQRARIALKLATKAYPGRFVPVAPPFWTALQPKFQKELSDLAREAGIILVTEEATDADGVSVTQVK